MLITLTEVKSLLQITGNDKDSLINYLMPIIEQKVCNECKDDFVDNDFDFFSSGDITFIASDNSINLTGIGSKKLVADDTIRVYGSFRNNQIFTIDSVGTNKIIVNSIDMIKDEDEGETTYITKIKYPVPLKIIAAQMIGYDLEKITPGVKSEKIDDYSITLQETVNGYPANYMSGLHNYRQVYHQSLFTTRRMWI
jgi:hypothetical protein